MNITYQEIHPEQVDLIHPLWEKLRAHNVGLAPQFASRRAARTFASRKRELLAKTAGGDLKIDVVYWESNPDPVGYCITSFLADRAGEIDSLFVDQDFRDKGIGTELTRRALTWLDAHRAVSKTVVVAFGNEPALAFYARFGFLADRITLHQVPQKE